MYAVVKTSGRQYRVAPGDSFSVEKLEGLPGSTFDLDEVLMIGGEKVLIGSPTVQGAKVTVVVEKQFRGPKILVFKKKRRHKYRNMRGHRSELTQLFVSAISSPAGTVNAESKPHVLDPNREKKIAQVAADGETKAPAKKLASAKKASAKPKSKAAKKKAGAKKSSVKAKKR